ncbi:metallophosphoesterase family protein [Hyphomonas oceanitis]|uniref:metallophosphoesterase family protein n=1 Tax=Hyphomonas oceanitis TaxID=81033 RepID=UPI003AB9B943
MIRLLAFSDIHNNMQAVRVLRAQESNAYDAILVAGDIGGESVNSLLEICSSFQCPIHFVYGNWDFDATYGDRDDGLLGPIHHSIRRVGDIQITGFSGCPTAWGNNPQHLAGC